ncbi:MAG: hypothetical protein UZ18_ATM001000965 [Armatimonadetes bacterium OLB18]|nr:MAG: hypothetical protein UZ18_ATM001000965 [Armatimonadetes bacterium OLB18]
MWAYAVSVVAQEDSSGEGAWAVPGANFLSPYLDGVGPAGKHSAKDGATAET